MIDFWRSRKDLLEVDIRTDVGIGEEKDSEVEVEFFVSNTASPPDTQYPEIIFDDVTLRISTKADSPEIVRLGSVGPGGSTSVKRTFRYQQLIDLEYELEGTVSPEAYFRVKDSGKMPAEAVSLSVTAYLQLVTDLQIHSWFNSTLKTFPTPGPETTLGDLESLAVSLDKPILEIRETGQTLQRIAGLVKSMLVDKGRVEREAVSEHRNAIISYLKQTEQSIAQLRDALKHSDAKRVSGTLSDVIERLEQEAKNVDQITELLQQPQEGSNPGVKGPNPDSDSTLSGSGSGGSLPEEDDSGQNHPSSRTIHDDRSDSMNPNNPSYQAAQDNRSNQLNPNNPAYHSSRGRR